MVVELCKHGRCSVCGSDAVDIDVRTLNEPPEVAILEMMRNEVAKRG